MRKSYAKRYAVWGSAALLAGFLGLGIAWADKDGVPNAHANDNAQGDANDDEDAAATTLAPGCRDSRRSRTLWWRPPKPRPAD